MNKIINIFSSICSVIVMVLLTIICNINMWCNYFNGITILIFISMLMINPLCNLYRQNKKQINNLIYHLIFNLSLIYIIYIYIKTIYIHYSIGINASNIFITDKLLIILIIILGNYILSLFFKKEIIPNKEHNRIFNIVIIIISLLGIIYTSSYIHGAVSGIIMLMSLILFIKNNDLIIKEEYRKIYFVLIILCLYNCNFISAILFIQMYINLDKYGLNI